LQEAASVRRARASSHSRYRDPRQLVRANITVPVRRDTGNVVVTVGGVATNALPFTVTAPAPPPTPTLTGLSPASGPVGTAIAITGANFGATQGASLVTFNGTRATPTTWSATTIAVPVPAGATSGTVLVSVSGVATNQRHQTVPATPTPTRLPSRPRAGQSEPQSQSRGRTSARCKARAL
jgi:hypothetical protein